MERKPKLIVNLQGDMPNIKPEAISDLVKYMDNGKYDIGTLASNLESQEKLNNANIVKVAVKKKLENNNFLKADDFFRINTNTSYNLYHHIGIYAFTNKALIRYVSLKRSKLELERKLEQLRALESNMSIHVGYIKSPPLSVDTEEDLNEVQNLMEKNEKIKIAIQGELEHTLILLQMIYLKMQKLKLAQLLKKHLNKRMTMKIIE